MRIDSDITDNYERGSPISFQLCILVILPTLAATWLMMSNNNGINLVADSPGYIYFDSSRPVGYPLFIWSTKQIFGTFSALRIVQLLIICFTFSTLAICLFLVTRSMMVGVTLEAMLFVNPGPLHLADNLASDGLSCGFTAIFTAIVALFAFHPHRRSLLLSMIITSALAVTIRPINIALPVATVIAVVLFCEGGRMQKIFRLLAVVGATTIGILLSPVLMYEIHGSSQVSSPLARSLLQKALFQEYIIKDNWTGNCDEAIISNITAPVAAYISAAPSDIRLFLKLRYSDYIRFKVIIPTLLHLHGLTREHDVDSILMCYTNEVIRKNMREFIKDSAMEYINLASYATFVSAAQLRGIERYLDLNPPVLPAAVDGSSETAEMARRAQAEIGGAYNNAAAGSDDNVFALPPLRSGVLVTTLKVFQLTVCLIAALSFYAIVLYCCGRAVDRRWRLVAVLGTLLQCELTITAIAEIGVPRYIFPLWPTSCTIAEIVAIMLCEYFLPRKSFQQLRGSK